MVFSKASVSVASFPGLPCGEGRPGTHCLRMRVNFPDIPDISEYFYVTIVYYLDRYFVEHELQWQAKSQAKLKNSSICSSLSGLPLQIEQETSLRAVYSGNKDALVWLPTGFGKSLCYTALPFAFDYKLGRIGGDCVSLALVDRPGRQYKGQGSQFCHYDYGLRSACAGRSCGI